MEKDTERYPSNFSAALLDGEAAVRAAGEAAALKKLFRSWGRSREGAQIIGNLYQVFGVPPSGNADGLEYARFSGRQDVLSYILRHGNLLGDFENGDK